MWSGGKDSALALHRARQAGLDVAELLTFYDVDSRRVRFHATREWVMQEQAMATGIDTWHGLATSWPEMEARLRTELAAMRNRGLRGVVFGDIHLDDVRAWYEQRVRAAGLEHVEPLWGEQPVQLVNEFVEIGGRAVVTCVDLETLGTSWLGRIVDPRFVEEISALGIDPCGENGEFHTFAFDGPMFLRPLYWKPGEVRRDAGFSQLDVILA
jgi:diphthine-ammonia ligase